MAVFEGLPPGLYYKSRPKRYKADDAAYPTGGNEGYVVARLPKDYPLNSQQRKVKDAAETCGIKPGIDKDDLQDKMVNCIPDQF